MINNVTVEEFKGAVNITDGDAKGVADEEIEERGNSQTVGGIFPFNPIADNDIEFVNIIQKFLNLGDIKLKIGVHKEDKRAFCTLEPGDE